MRTQRQQSFEQLRSAIETRPLSIQEKANLLSLMMGKLAGGAITETEAKKILKSVKV